MDDQRTGREGGGGVAFLNEKMWRGVMYYIGGLATVLATLYVLPASRASIYLYFGGTVTYFVSNIMVIMSATALEFIAVRDDRWLPSGACRRCVTCWSVRWTNENDPA